MSPDIEACLKGLPRKLKIGSYDWTLIVHPFDAENENHGETVYLPKIINLWPKDFTGPDHAAGIALHEVLHAIYDDQGLDSLPRKKESREEKIIVGFEAGLVSLFRDNPRFMRWLAKWLR